MWKQIKGFENLYEISSCGRVKSLKRFVKSKSRRGKKFYFIVSERILKPGFNRNYYQVHLCKNGKYPLFEIARLVADAFIPNPENKPQVNHINGNKLDNRVDNLEWCTASENQYHSYQIGLHSAVGERNGQSKLTENDIREIRALYSIKTNPSTILAKKYNVVPSCIRAIIRRELWSHVK